MKTLKFTLAILASSILLTSCFTNGNLICRKAQGETNRVEYSATDFNRIELQMNADVYLYKGDDFNVEVEATENIHEILVANVVGSELTLRTERGKCIRGKSDVVYYITCPDIESVVLSGSGNIYSDAAFSGESLELRISGSGEIELKNFTYNNNIVSITGSGDLLLTDFSAIDAELKTSGSGSIEYKSAQLTNIDASLSGSGKVIFEGSNAEFLKSNISGSGKVEAFNMPVNIADVKIGGSGRIELFVNDELSANITGSGNVYYKGNPSVDANVTGSGKVVKED